MKENEERVLRNCKEIWEGLYEQQTFENEL
jgi:hypothetical protein